VHRFRITVMRGGYAGHGETYMHPEDLLWWAKGGVLRGESWKRIAFLRDLLEQDVKRGLTAAEIIWIPATIKVLCQIALARKWNHSRHHARRHEREPSRRPGTA
jgi:hypothetical protein